MVIYTVQSISNEYIKDSVEKKISNEESVDGSKGPGTKIIQKKERMIRLNKETKTNDYDVVKNVYSLYGPLALLILTSASFGAALIPVHNVITHPKYWYEIIFSSCSSSFFMASCCVIGLETVLNPFNNIILQVFFDLFITFKLTEILICCSIHMIWSAIFRYIEPFPHRWTIMIYLSMIILYTRLYHKIPNEMRKEAAFRRKCKLYTCWLFYIGFITIQLMFMLRGIASLPHDIQWLIAMIVPLTKMMNDQACNKLIAESALVERLVAAKFMAKITNNLCYSLFLASLFTKVSKVTESILLGINFYMDMALCYKAIRLQRKVSTFDFEATKSKSLIEEAITELVLNETVEIIVPLAFIGSFTASYYGPNKDILGNVGCTIWEHQKVDDPWTHIFPVVIMALIDSISVILVVILLWNFTNINFFKEYCKTIKKYWIHLVFHGGSFWSCVSIIRNFKPSNLSLKL